MVAALEAVYSNVWPLMKLSAPWILKGVVQGPRLGRVILWGVIFSLDWLILCLRALLNLM